MSPALATTLTDIWAIFASVVAILFGVGVVGRFLWWLFFEDNGALW